MMKYNRYLTNVVAVVHDVQRKAQYMKETVEKSHVAFTITDGKKVINRTFFNEFGDSFLKAKQKVVEDPLIIIISAIKVSDRKELAFIEKKYTCPEPKCGRTYPYPDRRFQLYTFCADDTGTIPIVWKDDEICRITGKTVYDMEVNDIDSARGPVIPDLLKFCVNKIYNFSIILTKENVIEGSKETELTDTIMKDNSPPTGKSSNKIRTRINVDVEKDTAAHAKIPKFINVKVEKDEVICKGKIKSVEETKKWKVLVYTSCYEDIEDMNCDCKKCNRNVPYPNKKFKIRTLVSDDSGEMEITLLDREVRTSLGKNVFDVEKEEEIVEHQQTIANSETLTAEPSGSSYHLDEISQLNYQTT
ncbi:hypothetical protein POM88_050225 [Heracleum sosnowskyi]|uniref:Uncharacterized protein n=1 Tax=Heracleum sosnowskyi TaxID=360622 RepID=A0AAD8GZC3_9APIA|nr:hypothetical protein POM88_050225 [Heracleum sosnowskyi]